MSQQPLKSYMDLVNDCDCVPDPIPPNLYRLYLPNDPRPHGLIQPDTVNRMPWTSDFEIEKSETRPAIKLKDSIISINDSAATAASKITVAFQKLIDRVIEEDIFDIIHKTHSEPFLLPGSKAKGARIERFSQSLFGTVARGAHLTAYTHVKSESKEETGGLGELKIWVAKRSEKLFTYPGMLDSTVAGGVKADDTPTSCILEECYEEASLSKDFVLPRLRQTGVLTYITHVSSFASSATDNGVNTRAPGREKNLLSPETLYVFDLPLPENVKPVPMDDEVECFQLMSVGEVKTALAEAKFKTNSALVMIDFFVRHGILKSSEESGPSGKAREDFVEIVRRMHRELPVATGPEWNG